MSNWEINIHSFGNTGRMSGKTVWIQQDYDYHDQIYHCIDSVCFDKITPDDQNEAQSIIYGLVIITNGAFVLADQTIDKHVVINSSFISYNNHRVGFYKNEFIPSMNPFEGIRPPSIDLSKIDLYDPSDLITLSHKYHPIREILFQVGCIVDDLNMHRNISTWTILYAIMDTIIYYTVDFCPDCKVGKKVKKEKAIKFLKINESEHSRFGQTANNFDYLGIFARHGKQNFVQPKNPMTTMEAFSFVFNASMAFIAEFLNDQLRKEWAAADLEPVD